MPLEANGPRQHYMRAISVLGSDGLAVVTPVRSQDSSLLHRWPRPTACWCARHAPALPRRRPVPILPLDF